MLEATGTRPFRVGEMGRRRDVGARKGDWVGEWKGYSILMQRGTVRTSCAHLILSTSGVGLPQRCPSVSVGSGSRTDGQVNVARGWVSVATWHTTPLSMQRAPVDWLAAAAATDPVLSTGLQQYTKPAHLWPNDSLTEWMNWIGFGIPVGSSA